MAASEQTGLTVVNVTSWTIDDVFKVCLYQGNSIPSLNDLPLAPNAGDEEYASLGLMPMTGYLQDIRWDTIDQESEYYNKDLSLNFMTWDDYSNYKDRYDQSPEGQTYLNKLHAMMYWKSINGVEDSGIYEYRYISDGVFKDLKSFNTIIFYGWDPTANQSYILSYGYLDISVEFSSVTSIILDATVERNVNDNSIKLRLFEVYAVHSNDKSTLDKLTNVHTNLLGVITTTIDIDRWMDAHDKKDKLIIGITSSDGLQIKVDSNEVNYLDNGINSYYEYYLGEVIDASDVYDAFDGILFNEPDSESIPIDLVYFKTHSVASFDRSCGLFIIFYGPTYIIAVPTGYNKTGVAYKLDKDIFSNNLFVPTIMVYNRAVLIQVDKLSYLINPQVDSTEYEFNDRKIIKYNEIVSAVGYAEATIPPIFDLGNLIYYNEFHSFKNLFATNDIYPQSGFQAVIDIRFYNDSMKSLNQLESEYQSFSCMYDSVKDINNIIGLYDTGILIDSGNSITVLMTYPTIGKSYRYEVSKINNVAKYYLMNRVLLAILNDGSIYSVKLNDMPDGSSEDRQFTLLNDSMHIYARGINISI